MMLALVSRDTCEILSYVVTAERVQGATGYRGYAERLYNVRVTQVEVALSVPDLPDPS